MLTASEAIISFIKTRTLPDNWQNVLGDLYDDSTRTFAAQESTYWDYKREFPFSNSDDYFAGIVRLICGFYNTYGGIIIFGVHDELRTPGHNKVKINVERINNVLRQKLSTPIETVYRKYTVPDDDGAAVDILLIPKRPMAVAPVRPIEKVGTYRADTIWMRLGHEVIEPSSAQLPFLYASRDGFGQGDDNDLSVIPNSLPPNPATMKEFVGRRDALDRLYNWALNDEEPRMFLYGKGGSGKSTIAYEFVRMLAETGGRTNTRTGRPFDFAIYLSAKKKALDPISGKTVELSSFDFSTATEKLKGILLLSEWMEPDQIEKLSDKALLSEAAQLFDTAQILIVIDDIDTLTTAGIDPGMDALYRLLSRAKAGGKVLYTLRNAPSQSLSNSIEVPGLHPDDEYPDFARTCCAQFKVASPPLSVLTGAIAIHSERRPLAVEVILGLRRTAGGYEEAIRLFLGKDGEGARRYLFQREYDALSADNRSRLLLAALALFKRPVSFADLQTVLHCSPEQVKDAIGETLEMFLQVNENSSGKSLYRLGQATEVFITEVSGKLTQFEKLKANVKYFNSPFLPQNNEVAQIKFRIRSYLAANDAKGAYEFLYAKKYGPFVTQHPEYNVMLGTVISMLAPVKFDELRSAFRQAVETGATDAQAMRDWYWTERNSGFGGNAAEVCDLVITKKQFPSMIKAEFYGKKGHVVFERARSGFLGDPEASLSNLSEAVTCFLESQAIEKSLKIYSAKNATWLADAFRYYMICVKRSLDVGRTDLAFKLCDFLSQRGNDAKYAFDAAEPAIMEFCAISANVTLEVSVHYRPFINRLAATLDKKAGVRFIDEKARLQLVNKLRATADKLRSS